MAVPTIAPLHFFLLRTLEGGKLSARALAEQLEMQGCEMSASVFELVMSLMEQVGQVEGQDAPGLLFHPGFAKRTYTLTTAGRDALKSAREFLTG